MTHQAGRRTRQYQTALAIGVTLATAAALVFALPSSRLESRSAVSFSPAGEDGDDVAPLEGVPFGLAPVSPIGTAICTTAPSLAANVNTDCEPNEINNETSIAVNPTNAANIIGAANEYQLSFTRTGNLGHVSGTPRAHVSFDGGRSWADYPIVSNLGRALTSDPSVAFDATGRAYYAMLASSSEGVHGRTNYDVLVASSTDGGQRWSTVQVAAGGTLTGVNDYLDKNVLAAWGTGHAIVTYTDYRAGAANATFDARIVASVTRDGGGTWTAPVVISDSSDAAFLATPAVAADGRVYVAYLSGGDSGRGLGATYAIVEVDPATGERIAGPFEVGALVDDLSDSPTNIAGRPTYQDSELRGIAIGNLATDPTDPAHLAVIWSDMRNSPRPAPTNPYAAATNSDVIVSQSSDRGRTWSLPAALNRPGDQFQPWGAYDFSGRLRIGVYDRAADPANHRYDYSIASEIAPGALSFAIVPVSTMSSDPTRDDEWFAITVDPAFPNATRFLGDYTAIAIVPGTTTVLAYWTDMRETACVAGRCGHGQNGYFALSP